MSFDHVETAQQVRDIMKQLASQVVSQDAPKPQFGRVISVNFVAMTASIWFPGDDAPVTVRLFSSVLPGTWQEKFGLGSGAGIASNSFSGYGSIAAVENFQGKQYITQILNGGQFSIDYEMAGSMQVMYDSQGNPDNPGAAEYVYQIVWNTFGDNSNAPLPSNGGPFAINIGPFLSPFGGQPGNGIFDVELVSGSGLSQRYQFNLSPYRQMSENNFSSIYNRWFRVIPASVDETDKSANTQRQINKFGQFDQGIGDWLGTGNASATVVSGVTPAPPSGTGFALKVQSTVLTSVVGAREFNTAYRVAPGAGYFIQYQVMSPTLWSDVRVAMDWYDSSQVFISSSVGSITAISANTWTVISGTLTAPATAYYGMPRVYVGASAPITQPFHVDNFSMSTGGDATSKTDFSLDVALRQTVYGAVDGDPPHSPGELWIRIYIHWLDAIQNPLWTVRVRNTASFAQAKSVISGKPIYEYVTAPSDAVGYLGYHDSNAIFTTNTTQYIGTESGAWSSGPWRNPDLSLGRRAQDSLSGGGVITWDGSLLKWSAPFEIGGMGRSRHGLILGKGTIAMPTSGVIPILPSGSQTATLVGTGIPLAAGQALYYGIPPGSGSTLPVQGYFNGGLHGEGGFFIVDGPNDSRWWTVPEWAVLIAYRQSDANYAEIKLGTGQIIDKWRPLSYQNSWHDQGSGRVAGAWKFHTPNSIRVRGESTGGTKTDGTTIAVLPTQARASIGMSAPLGINPMASGSTSPLLQTDTSGNITIFGLGTGGTTIYYDVTWGLD